MMNDHGLSLTAIEFGERLCYFGLATNLIIYLTRVLHQELKTAAKNVNYWSGVTSMMPLVGGFVADAYLGRFSTVLLSTLIYIGVHLLARCHPYLLLIFFDIMCLVAFDRCRVSAC